MTLVSNDPDWWPIINADRIGSYFLVAACAGVMYDWVLTFAQEVELVWRQRWSLMTGLYLSMRFLGISYVVTILLTVVPTIPMTDAGCRISYFTTGWTGVVVTSILGVIMVARLHAMYQRRKMLIFLFITFLAFTIANGVTTAILLMDMTSEEFIISGNYICFVNFGDNASILLSISWGLTFAWEVLAMCLAIRIAVQHFRELRQLSTGGVIGDCFTVLMKSHLVYFISLVAVYCFNLGSNCPGVALNPLTLEGQIYIGLIQIFTFIQLFVLGPRLILSIREYHAKLVADSDAATAMTSISFLQERVHVSTSSSV